MEDGPVNEEARKRAQLRALPSIDELLNRPSLAPLFAAHPRPLSVAAVRRAVSDARARVLRGEPRAFDEGDVEAALAELSQSNLRRVLNATGVVLHTNLGRAPLAQRALDRVAQVARGYSNLEYDLDEGERGSRYAPVVELLCGLTGAEDALVVNNNAGAVLLVLAALAQGKEAIVSRGELVEIGGGFRVPDVMRQSGARLVEVGTTNRTRISDYAGALGPQTGLLVKVHKSNFAFVGFTEEVSTSELAKLSREAKVALFEDLGSGSLIPLTARGLTPEPTVRQTVEAGADVVSFSGDKLLGGPQAGIIVGRRELIAKVRGHPLNRALRIDKMTVAALEATLELYREERHDQVPALRLLQQDVETLRARAQALRESLRRHAVASEVQQTVGQVGGGAMPLAHPVSFACLVAHERPDELLERLREADPPVIARIADGAVVLDVRCLEEGELDEVAKAVAASLSQGGITNEK